ncbi:hypothetical protein [Ruegeria sp.]|uniref:hypothetical protein n=1 Tax=Ruegeria sp. TaxID=1879320 RepID=UPI0023160918|nr:hypothetical protein [Ruegeria sp.]MDA7965111.1 hypothetical protein [Ruegeria sp.]
MQRILILSVACAAMAVPAHAQEEDSQSLMEKGAELFFEGLRQEMEPALDDLLGLADQFGPAMQSFVQEMGPALTDLAAKIEDWSVYEAPEILPNGDIIIRRKPEPEDEPQDQPEPSAPSGEITDI